MYGTIHKRCSYAEKTQKRDEIFGGKGATQEQQKWGGAGGGGIERSQIEEHNIFQKKTSLLKCVENPSDHAIVCGHLMRWPTVSVDYCLRFIFFCRKGHDNVFFSGSRYPILKSCARKREPRYVV